MNNNDSETLNPISDMASKGKYEVNATFKIGNNDALPVMLTFTAEPAFSDDKNIILVFNKEYYNGTIDCPKIDDIKGTFKVADDIYTLKKVNDLSGSADLNYVQLKCDGDVHQFELKKSTSSSDVIVEVGGKRSRKAWKKAGKKASHKVGGRRAKRRTIRRRGTRKK